MPSDAEGAPALVLGVLGHRRGCPHSASCRDAWEAVRDEYASRHGVPWVELDPGPDPVHADGDQGGGNHIDIDESSLRDDGRRVSACLLGAEGTPAFFVFRAEGRRPLELAWRGHAMESLRAALAAAVTGQAAPPVGGTSEGFTPWPADRPRGRGGGAADVGASQAKYVGNYHGDTDFERDEVREEAEAALERQERERSQRAGESSGVEVGSSQAEEWEAFHAELHASRRFFKDRRYLVGEFPELTATPGGGERWLDVLEVGCGTGNACIPVLGANPRARLYACDFSEAAVAATADKAEQLLLSEGEGDRRFRAGVCDPVRSSLPLRFGDEGSGFGAAMLIFMLSAVAPADHADVMRRVAESLRPGGFVAFRDYGNWDMAMLRFPGTQRVSDRLYVRQDGTLAYFFELADLQELAGEVGLVVEELRWCRIAVTNRKNGNIMRRIFVHAKLRKPL